MGRLRRKSQRFQKNCGRLLFATGRYSENIYESIVMGVCSAREHFVEERTLRRRLISHTHVRKVILGGFSIENAEIRRDITAKKF
jgi:hypothetical protein